MFLFGNILFLKYAPRKQFLWIKETFFLIYGQRKIFFESKKVLLIQKKFLKCKQIYFFESKKIFLNQQNFLQFKEMFLWFKETVFSMCQLNKTLEFIVE